MNSAVDVNNAFDYFGETGYDPMMNNAPIEAVRIQETHFRPIEEERPSIKTNAPIFPFFSESANAHAHLYDDDSDILLSEMGTRQAPPGISSRDVSSCRQFLAVFLKKLLETSAVAKRASLPTKRAFCRLRGMTFNPALRTCIPSASVRLCNAQFCV